MGFLSTLCCCFYRSPRVCGDGASVSRLPTRIKPAVEAKADEAPILVPYFPVNSNLSRL
ncbi:Protein phosphatase 1 regulatory subunit like [Actinidia chinensis var. chinensis]|uniref:Protein phosphatase 1 regulatory subunit like n=1 Tax=Actinidia chinensis var. chinensis TaxID=1590841 RepID=A0A2R6S206_ACTCC|nr:Protein phosphatase 1 regulatory subunit like [Actinidia chinensis var. chinensis]